MSFHSRDGPYRPVIKLLRPVVATSALNSGASKRTGRDVGGRPNTAVSYPATRATSSRVLLEVVGRYWHPDIETILMRGTLSPKVAVVTTARSVAVDVSLSNLYPGNVSGNSRNRRSCFSPASFSASGATAVRSCGYLLASSITPEPGVA